MGCMNRKELSKLKLGERVRPRTVTGPNRTKQEFAQESDINYIMERYRVTGQLPAGGSRAAVFADVSEIGSFANVLERVHAAEVSFNSLPASLRSRFRNDPVQLIEFLQDSRNRVEAVKLGLIPKKEEVSPVPAPEDPAKSNTPKA